MLDKMALVSPNPRTTDFDEIKSLLKDRHTHSHITSSKYYESILVLYEGTGKANQQVITVQTNPTNYTANPIKIELNPNKFGSFKKVLEIVSIFDDPSNLKITRLDHTVDVPVQIDLLYRSLIYSRKKTREVYGDGVKLSGVYIGAYPEKLVIYDKAGEAGLPPPLSRIELCQHVKKVFIKNLDKLPELISYRPFNFRLLKIADPENLTSLREHQKASFLREALCSLGAQGAYKSLNKYSNFKRDFSSILVEDTSLPDINKIYQENLKSFFESKEAL